MQTVAIEREPTGAERPICLLCCSETEQRQLPFTVLPHCSDSEQRRLQRFSLAACGPGPEAAGLEQVRGLAMDEVDGGFGMRRFLSIARPMPRQASRVNVGSHLFEDAQG